MSVASTIAPVVSFQVVEHSQPSETETRETTEMRAMLKIDRYSSAYLELVHIAVIALVVTATCCEPVTSN
jgi:hypothetical protein